jgi:hypothetical protein
MISIAATGLTMPAFDTLARLYPQLALAIAEGVPCRPSGRILSAQFASATIGQVIPASFSEIFGGIAIFCGCEESIDPTSAFPGNILKYLSDTCQARVTGVTFTLTVKGGGTNDWDPIPEETPLQLVPGTLNPWAGGWVMNLPDNVKARFTLAAAPIAVPFTAWLNMSFAVLGEGCGQYSCLDRKTAQKRLRDDHGIGFGGSVGGGGSSYGGAR